MLIILTGNGKGKTTSALGQALRAVGSGKKVLMVQFIKGPWKSGEDFSHQKLLPYFKIIKFGLGFVGIGGDKLPIEKHRGEALKGLKYAQIEVDKKEWDMLILDEIWNAHHLKLLKTEEILKFISDSKEKVEHIIMTGRDCPKTFIDLADLVTEMKEIKHPFNNSVTGSKGLEY